VQSIRVGGVDRSSNFEATCSEIRSSSSFRRELLQQCGLHYVASLKGYAPVPRVKHSLPSIPAASPTKTSSSVKKLSLASALNLQSLCGFVQYELHKARSKVVSNNHHLAIET